jgi:hypothetical protein
MPKKVLNMKIRGKHQRGRREQQVWRDVTQKEGGTCKEIEEQELWENRDRFDPHEVEMSYEDEDCSLFNITYYPCIN